MRWEVGMTVGVDSTMLTIHDSDMEPSDKGYKEAVQCALDVTQSMYPDQVVELDYVKEYDE